MAAILVVQGGMWGSEGKGGVAGWLAVGRDIDFAVRTGAINAGHTVYYKGKPYVNQQLPTAWVNTDTRLVIGPGAYVHMPTLLREIAMIKEATGVDPSQRIYIDRRASIHWDDYARESAEVNRHHLIGATGKGCAEAIVHKIVDRGKADLILSRAYPAGYPHNPWWWADVPDMLTRAYDSGARIMLEGTQGELLDFHLGPWPYVTSRQTTSAAWVAEAGLSPSLEYEIVLVLRTYPIRVAGNSGPLPNETTWPILARVINHRLDDLGIGEHPLRVSWGAIEAFDHEIERESEASGLDLARHFALSPLDRERERDTLSEYSNRVLARLPAPIVAELRKLFEFTTITKKLRRIAYPDYTIIEDTVRKVRPAWIALTFLNYAYPELHGSNSIPEYARWFAKKGFGEKVKVVSTGSLPEHMVWV